MQAVKEKLSDLNSMRKAKAEARAEEKTQKDVAKARVDIAHEVRMAKEAEAAVDLHVAKAGQLAEKEIAKHAPHLLDESAAPGGSTQENIGMEINNSSTTYPPGASRSNNLL